MVLDFAKEGHEDIFDISANTIINQLSAQDIIDMQWHDIMDLQDRRKYG